MELKKWKFKILRTKNLWNFIFDTLECLRRLVYRMRRVRETFSSRRSRLLRARDPPQEGGSESRSIRKCAQGDPGSSPRIMRGENGWIFLRWRAQIITCDIIPLFFLSRFIVDFINHECHGWLTHPRTGPDGGTDCDAVVGYGFRSIIAIFEHPTSFAGPRRLGGVLICHRAA